MRLIFILWNRSDAHVVTLKPGTCYEGEKLLLLLFSFLRMYVNCDKGLKYLFSRKKSHILLFPLQIQSYPVRGKFYWQNCTISVRGGVYPSKNQKPKQKQKQKQNKNKNHKQNKKQNKGRFSNFQLCLCKPCL